MPERKKRPEKTRPDETVDEVARRAFERQVAAGDRPVDGDPEGPMSDVHRLG